MRRFSYLCLFSGFNLFYFFSFLFTFPGGQTINKRRRRLLFLHSGNGIESATTSVKLKQFIVQHHLGGLGSTVVLSFISYLAYTMN